MAFGAIKPEGPKVTPPKSMKPDSSIEYGEYFANYVANCVGCHTNRDLKTGAFIGEPYAGELAVPPDAFSKGWSFITPNLTPDPKTGIMAKWTEEAFVNRFKAGRAYPGSPMPWGAFTRMTETELKGLYRYMNSLKPVEHKVGRTAYPPGEAVPES